MFDPASLSVMLGLLQAGSGLLKKTGQYPSLDYKTPPAQLEALNNAKYMSSLTEMPGSSTIRDTIGQNTQNTVSNLAEVAGNQGSLMGGISRAGESANKSLRTLGVDNANFFTNNQGALRNELGRVASYQDKEQVLENQDNLREYEMNVDRKQALLGGGATNIMNGTNSLMMSQFYKGLLENLNGEEEEGIGEMGMGRLIPKQATSTMQSYGNTIPRNTIPLDLNSQPKNNFDIWSWDLIK